MQYQHSRKYFALVAAIATRPSQRYADDDEDDGDAENSVMASAMSLLNIIICEYLLLCLCIDHLVPVENDCCSLFAVHAKYNLAIHYYDGLGGPVSTVRGSDGDDGLMSKRFQS